MAEVGIFTVHSSQGTTAMLVDAMDQKLAGVPGAVIHPAKSASPLRVGQIALCFSWATPAVLGRVARVDAAGGVVVQHDWAGATAQARVDHAEPMARGLAPLAFVEFPRSGGSSRGIVIALSDRRGWLRTDSGHIEIRDRSVLRPLELDGRPLAVGDAVRAYSWVGGFRRGVVRRVLEPGLRYAVQTAEDRPEQIHFFDSLVKAR